MKFKLAIATAAIAALFSTGAAAQKTEGYVNLNYVTWLNVPQPYNVVQENARNRGIDIGVRNYMKLAKPLYFGLGLQISNTNIHSNYQRFEFDPQGNLNPAYDLNNPLYAYRHAYFNGAPTVHYVKNKISLNYLEIPLELMLRPGEKQNFTVAVGAMGGLGISVTNKLKTDDAVYKIKDWDNIQRLRGGVYARLGYKAVNLYARMDLTNTFKASKGGDKFPATDFQVVSLGLNIQTSK